MKDRILKYLSDEYPWRESIHYEPTITSTNDVLKQMAAQGAPHGTVLIAGHQTGGRGRLGRSFLSPPDVGIYLSMLLRPSSPPDQLMHLTCAVGNAVCDAIESVVGIRPGIKWTNDIVCRKRKLAGILTEMVFGTGQQIDCAIIGIGINCTQSPGDFPEEIRDMAGSLAMVSGKEIDRAAVAAAVIEALAGMDGILLPERHAIMERYRKNCITIGQEVSVVRGESIRYGKALEVDENGGLIVAFRDGDVETVSSGEVSVRGLYHYV